MSNDTNNPTSNPDRALANFLGWVANLPRESAEFTWENDEAWDTLHLIISEARRLVSASGDTWVIASKIDRDDDGTSLAWHNGDPTDPDAGFTGWGSLEGATTWDAPDWSLNLPLDGKWSTLDEVAYQRELEVGR